MIHSTYAEWTTLPQYQLVYAFVLASHKRVNTGMMVWIPEALYVGLTYANNQGGIHNLTSTYTFVSIGQIPNTVKCHNPPP